MKIGDGIVPKPRGIDSTRLNAEVSTGAIYNTFLKQVGEAIEQ